MEHATKYFFSRDQFVPLHPSDSLECQNLKLGLIAPVKLFCEVFRTFSQSGQCKATPLTLFQRTQFLDLTIDLILGSTCH